MKNAVWGLGGRVLLLLLHGTCRHDWGYCVLTMALLQNTADDALLSVFKGSGAFNRRGSRSL